MSVDSWQPIQPATDITASDLKKMTDFAHEEKTNLTSELDWIQPFIQGKKEIWSKAAENLGEAELIALIRWFTLLEKEQNWDLGEGSPVIPLFKHYKKTCGINRELVKWVKEHSENKYLPFGPLL
ncbi:hypothetical protein HF888_11355 [Bermanella marisrubri]|uniref:Uncharacterized protein n=1 Tax=Bermanella marisrubri TaxID=207949 RepID=Q1N176_9GAMM|nr:hypothetical protein [Bermanella marisrubri]EAT11975.1 hypothetical protein RED65_11560 [Oceanobacter sp. RED65] [Bermanella marisrubri]QIZ84779.1 hypothetical protein HF888_11355 [Bermanella marisrubri]